MFHVVLVQSITSEGSAGRTLMGSRDAAAHIAFMKQAARGGKRAEPFAIIALHYRQQEPPFHQYRRAAP